MGLESLFDESLFDESLVRELYLNPHVIDVREDVPKGDLQLEKTSGYTTTGMGFLIKENDPDRAVQFFEKGLELNPKDPHAHYGLGLAYNQLGDRTAAHEHYTQAINFGGETWALRASALANRGSTLFGLSRPADAIHDCSEALKLDPIHETAYRNIGTFYLQFENYEAALFYFDFGLQEISGLPLPSPRENAMSYWKEYHNSKIPRDSPLMLGRARALIGFKRYDEARDVLDVLEPGFESEVVEVLRKEMDSS